MAIFARRVIQRLVDENAVFLSPEQTEEHVKRLNADNPASLATEWEVAVLNAFSCKGTVVHEPDLSGDTRVDLHFTTADADTEFVADVATVSDVTAHDQNPIDDFMRELQRQVRKRGMSAAGFHVQVGDQLVGEFGDQKVKLRLPRKNRSSAFIKRHLMPFVERIKTNPTATDCQEFVVDDVQLEISYDPTNRISIGYGHSSFDIAYSLKHNTLSNMLDAKAKQLRKCGFDGIKGIIICDGGCSTVSNEQYGNLHYDRRRLVQKFLGSTRSISFVSLVWVHIEDDRLCGGSVDRSVRYTSFINPDARALLPPSMQRVLGDIERAFRTPERTGANALHFLASPDRHCGSSFYGGFSMGGYQVKISARTLHRLLAGDLPQEEFFRDHGKDASMKLHERFRDYLKSGRTIEKITIEKRVDEDDDWVVLSFSRKPNAAISRFVSP